MGSCLLEKPEVAAPSGAREKGRSAQAIGESFPDGAEVIRAHNRKAKEGMARELLGMGFSRDAVERVLRISIKGEDEEELVRRET